MAQAHWRVGNTKPAILIQFDLGTDPRTGLPRTLAETDVVTQIMRNQTTPGPAITRTLEIFDAATNKVIYDPDVGDLDEAGLYKVMFDITDVDDEIESVPDDEALDYEYLVGARRDS